MSICAQAQKLSFTQAQAKLEHYGFYQVELEQSQIPCASLNSNSISCSKETNVNYLQSLVIRVFILFLMSFNSWEELINAKYSSFSIMKAESQRKNLEKVSGVGRK